MPPGSKNGALSASDVQLSDPSKKGKKSTTPKNVYKATTNFHGEAKQKMRKMEIKNKAKQKGGETIPINGNLTPSSLGILNT